MRLRLLFACLAAFAATIGIAELAIAQDDPPPHCGTYPNGRPRGCAGPGTGGMEAACLAQARVEICMMYYRFNCQRGFAVACRLATIGQNCSGGDPRQCSYFQQLLNANRACTLDGNQQACFWLRQQGFS